MSFTRPPVAGSATGKPQSDLPVRRPRLTALPPSDKALRAAAAAKALRVEANAVLRRGLAAPQRSNGAAVAAQTAGPATAGPDAGSGSDRGNGRAMPLMRRYEGAWLTASGGVEEFSRLAPATPLFEEAFSALARGTLIATEAGPVAVEDLVPGMRILTEEGRTETLTWLGTMTLFPEAAATATEPARLVRVTGEAFGLNRPSGDVVLGPHARLLWKKSGLRPVVDSDMAYAPARAFADAISVIEVAPLTAVSVYHLVLERQGTLRASGLGVESYHPGEALAERVEPQMLALFLSLFPQVGGPAGFGAPAHPRLTRFETEALLAA